MKKLFIILIITLSYNIKPLAQTIINNDTEVIENYFYQNNNENTITDNALNNEINISQSGENNTIDISSTGKKIQLVRQVGDDNNYQYYSFYDSSSANLNINQFGDENDIQIYGHNSIIENLKIIQTTNNQTILILNH